jgi:hypothetical protein
MTLKTQALSGMATSGLRLVGTFRRFAIGETRPSRLGELR